ncbi:MAG: HAD-IA family hydrolase [Pseudomonadota bacterium]
MTPSLIVWDFDGVLNRNVVDGRFIWADRLEADLGIDQQAFSDFIFRSGRIRSIVRGDLDLHQTVADWLVDTGHQCSADEVLAYWFEKDALPDPEILSLLQAVPCRHVIGTNNEALRASYIETEMGFARHVERVFSSGRMGVAKPERAFFEAITAWSGVPVTETLLIDDSAANVPAARALGWQAFHFTDESRADLKRLLRVE